MKTRKAKPAGRSDRFVIIMAGGRGERFWPVSREKTPKQLLRLLGETSFLQQAVQRVLPLVPIENVFVITNAALYWLTGTVGSSFRYYFEEAHSQDRPTSPTTVPTGVAIFAEDFQSVPKLAHRDHANIVSWNHYDRGSHFSHQAAPDLALTDLRTFFRHLR